MRSLVTVDPANTEDVVDAVRQALSSTAAVCVTTGEVDVSEVPDECAIVVLTSGSTAAPKRVALSGEALRASAQATSDAIGVGNWVLALPLTYIAGIMVVVRSIVDQTQLVDLRSEPFDAQAFTDQVANLPGGTWFTSVVPAQLARLVDLAERDADAARALARFSAILVGGQAIPEGLVSRAEGIGARAVRTYGSAETAGGVVYDGVPIGDTALRTDAAGVLHISTSSLAHGYLGDPERTAREFTIDANGQRWFRTSDRATVVDGKLTVLGRVDDIIVTGGVKVSLADIDRVLEKLDGTSFATWFTDQEWGQVPAVVGDSPIDLDNLRALVERELGKAARPYRAVTVDAIPTLPSGKPDRRALHEIAERNKP
jgi:O-succinylbenzoic acid--CoA ligase